jgi:hypothetical protein
MLKQTSILNGYNLYGKIFIFNLIFILNFDNLAKKKKKTLSHFGFRFFIKDVLLWCLMSVCVNKKIVPNFFCLVIDIYEKKLHMVHEKNVKIQNSHHKVPTFW